MRLFLTIRLGESTHPFAMPPTKQMIKADIIFMLFLCYMIGLRFLYGNDHVELVASKSELAGDRLESEALLQTP